MTSQQHSERAWPKMVGGVVGSAALGAAAMYVFDPDRGRRRRAIARDKAGSVIAGTREFMNAAAHDIACRAQGIQAQALRRFRRERVVDDLVLIERVRARLGRVVSHPHAIQVGAQQGRITLSGPILAAEARRLLASVHAVPGVRAIEDHLVAHERADSTPSLQGGAERRAMRTRLLGDNWSPTLRLAAIVGGGLLAAYGMRNRNWIGITLASIGASAVVAGTQNHRRDNLSQRHAVE